MRFYRKIESFWRVICRQNRRERRNEICQRQMKSTKGGWNRYAIKSCYAGWLTATKAWHSPLASDIPKGGRRGKRILSRNRRSSSRRRTRVRREGENGDSKQKDRKNQRNSQEFLPYYPLAPIKNKWRGLFEKNPLFVYGYAEIRQSGQTDFEQKSSFFDPKAYEGTSRGRKRR